MIVTLVTFVTFVTFITFITFVMPYRTRAKARGTD